MQYFLNTEGQIIVHDLIETIIANTAFLSEVDGAIGDGDHGINMNKGFSLCRERMGAEKLSMSEAFKLLGKILVMEIGGSMGPLYGTFFKELAKTSKDKEKIDAPLFADMLKTATDAVQALGNAKQGDKSLLDTLIPALESFCRANAEGKSFKEALAELSTAAERGKESTKDMVAKIGRASRLGERSRGTLDAGATSCWLILRSMADSITRLLHDDAA